VLLTALLGLTFAQWSPRGGGDHGGADWTPANGDVISGNHTNVGNFTITAGYTVAVLNWTGGDTSGKLRVAANNITVNGTLTASGRGYGGGGGGQNDYVSMPGGQAGTGGNGGAGAAATWGGTQVYWGGGGGGGSPNGAGGYPNGVNATANSGGNGGISYGYGTPSIGGPGYCGGGGGGAGFTAGGGGGGGGGTGGVSTTGLNGGNGGGPAYGPGSTGGSGNPSGSGGNGGYMATNANGDGTTNDSVQRGSGGGGCGTSSSGGLGGAGGGGGAGAGAVKLEAAGTLVVGSAGQILLQGSGGGQTGGPSFTNYYGGGGAGGGLLLRGNVVTLTSGCVLDVRGRQAQTLSTTNGGTIKVFYGSSLTNNSTHYEGRWYQVQMVIHNVGCTGILAPTGTVNSGSAVTPACSVYNSGNQTESYGVRMKIGSGYNNTASVSSHAAGTCVYVTFPTWTANPGGTIAVSCSTELTGDATPANDKRTGSVLVQVLDAQTMSVNAPTGIVTQGAVISPQARVKNNGNTQQTFTILFAISDGYNNTQSVTLAAAAESVMTFGSWTASTVGTWATKCSTQLSGDMTPGNDKATGTVTVNRYEVGVVAIVSPTDPSAPGSIIPRATVRNYGNARQLTTVTMQINSATPYSQTVSLSGGLPPGADTAVDFPAWTATNGNYVAHCSVSTANDPVRANDTLSKAFRVGNVDVAANAILAPVGNFDSTQVVTPSARVQNNGDFTATFKAFFRMSNFMDAVIYRESLIVNSLGVGVESTIAFPVWPKPHEPALYTTLCSVYVAGDGNGINDLASGAFTVYFAPPEPGWHQKASLPAGPKGKGVKDGGCLTAYEVDGADTSFIYALKGNGRYEFYRYNVQSNAWIAKESIPAIGSSGKKKAVKKGACMPGKLIIDPYNLVHAGKGNGTLEWWQYDPALSGTPTYPWKQMADVPAGAKACKEGCGAATVMFADTVYIYFLKGSGTQEFYRYNVATGIWSGALAPAPLGLSGKTWKNGSGLTAEDDWEVPNPLVYAIKGSTNELFAYDVGTNVWVTKAPLPFTGSSGKKKKVKDGAGIVFHDDVVYALKGGGTSEFWSYNADSDRWTQGTDIPAGSGKPVKGGGALTYASNPNALFALKGNNTLDFFKYGLSAYGLQLTANSQNEMSSGRQPSAVSRLLISPNPFSSTTTISYSLPTAANYSLRLYDVTGQLISTLASGNRNAGSYTLTTPTLARGIYVLKLATNNTTNTAKLIVE
jgi:hypothetical protein